MRNDNARWFRRVGRLALPPILLAALVLASAGTVAAQDLEKKPDLPQMKSRVKTLTMPRTAGRGNGTPEMLPCSSMVTRWGAMAGLKSWDEGLWAQTYPLQGEGFEGEFMRNVLGVVPGSGRLVHRWIVVGAHYDHLGRTADAPPAPATPLAGQYYPGANDNASGVVAMMALGELTEKGIDKPRRSVLFVGFSGEEIGLQGSRFYVENPLVPLDKIDLMINFDTIGRLEDGPLYIGGVGTAPQLREHIETANSAGLDLQLSEAGWAGSDHVPFLTNEVPALFFFTGPYLEYNRPDDTWDTLDYDGLGEIVALAHRLLESVRTDPENFPYQAVAGAPGEATSGTGEGNRNTWFGSVPDFADGAQGYRLSAVIPESPAARAGLQAGDVLVELGGQTVADLESFTRVLRRHAPGDIVDVGIRRDEQSLKFTVVLGDRADRED